MKEKYYTCRYDRPFKEIMLKESNKDILKKLLEHILKEEIEEITILPTERNNGNLKIKRKILDALLKTKNERIGLELNSNIESYVHPKNMAYIADMYASNILVGETYNEDTIFREYMTKEEDERKIYNTRMMEAEKNVLKKV